VVGRTLRWLPRFPDAHALYNPLPSSVGRICEYDRYYRLQYRTKGKGFCRCNYGTNQFGFEVIKTEIILGEYDQVSPQKEVV